MVQFSTRESSSIFGPILNLYGVAFPSLVWVTAGAPYTRQQRRSTNRSLNTARYTSTLKMQISIFCSQMEYSGEETLHNLNLKVAEHHNMRTLTDQNSVVTEDTSIPLEGCLIRLNLPLHCWDRVG